MRVFTLDRFFLPQGLWLFLNLVLITTAIGILFALPHNIIFYGMMMSGFLLSLIAQKFVFVNAELKSEVLSGLFLIGCALLMLLSHQKTAVDYIAPFFIGTGTGIIGARFLLFFIKLSHHCGEAPLRAPISWDGNSGLRLGWRSALCVVKPVWRHAYGVLSCLVVAALLIYQFFTHTWYLKHKNR